MKESMSLHEALLRWLSLANQQPESIPLSVSDVSDGVVMAQVLHKIDANYFHADWLTRIKHDLADNRRLKASNLKKVLTAMIEYTNDVIGIELNDFPLPDVSRAADGHIPDVSRMLQLILGCAVNCDAKQRYIETILDMEESVQQLIMHAIQELLNLQAVAHDPSLPALSSYEIRKMVDELREANCEKELLKQRCHELENRIQLLQEEKNNLSAEFEQLHAEMMGQGERSKEEHEDSQELKQRELKRLLDASKGDLYRLEKERDELQVKLEALERQMQELAAKEAEARLLADQARSLKDEVDILRETTDKVAKYEATIESYKKKLEEMADAKRQLKMLEEKTTTLMKENLDLEDQLKNTGLWKPQVSVFKRRIADYHTKLDAETKRADAMEFETKKLLEKLEALSIERDRLHADRDRLKEVNVELNEQLRIAETGSAHRRPAADKDRLKTDDDLLEMIPHSVKEKMLRMQRENQRLRDQQLHLHRDQATLQLLVDDFREREAKLETSNRLLNQRLAEMEGAQRQQPYRTLAGSRDELEVKLTDSLKKVSQLQDVVQKRDLEMQAMEERYKKYIEKAKAVIKTLDPKHHGAAPEASSVVRRQFGEKEAFMESMEHETDRCRAMKDTEERLISTAFYNFAQQLHTASVENRLNNIQSAASSATHAPSSLVARHHRPPPPRAAAGPVRYACFTSGFPDH